jgi:hypothetical protein
VKQILAWSLSFLGLLFCLPTYAENYAIMINGGANPDNTRPWDALDISRIYQALRLRNAGTTWKKRNISVFQTNGNSQISDIHRREMISFLEDKVIKESSLKDFDGDGKSEIAGPATKDSLRGRFQLLKNLIKKDDQLFLFVNDHGSEAIYDEEGKIIREQTINLWGEEIQVSELKRMLVELKKKEPGFKVGIAMSQCFSGAFQSIADIEGVCVMTAAAEDEESHSGLDEGSSEKFTHVPFNLFFSEALEKIPSPDLEQIYDYVTRRDWTIEWNDLSSQRLLRRIAGIPEESREALTFHYMGLQGGDEIRAETVSACSSEDSLKDIFILGAKVIELSDNFVGQYYENLDSQFERFSPEEQLSFIKECNITFRKFLEVEAALSGRFYGLQSRTDVSKTDFMEAQKTFFSAIISRTSQRIKIRGTCRRAQRIYEQDRTAPLLKNLAKIKTSNKTMRAINACREFKF